MIVDGDEEEDNDDQYRSMFSECDDIAMKDNEEEGGEERAPDDAWASMVPTSSFELSSAFKLFHSINEQV
jgi:hypothetical protein